MDKKLYLKELRRELDSLPFEERENAVSYYEEYLHEAGPEREAETIGDLGSPQAVAAKIRVEHATHTPPRTPKEGFQKIWLVVLAVFAAPIAMPLAIAVVAVIFALFVAMASMVFAIGVMAIALVGGGIFSVVLAVPLLVSDLPSFLFFLGGGIAFAGLGILLGYAIYVVATKSFGGLARLLGKFLNKARERRIK